MFDVFKDYNMLDETQFEKHVCFSHLVDNAMLIQMTLHVALVYCCFKRALETKNLTWKLPHMCVGSASIIRKKIKPVSRI